MIHSPSSRPLLRGIRTFGAELLIIIGIVFFTGNLLGFQTSRECGFTGFGSETFSADPCMSPPAYYYESESIALVTTGAALLVFGLLLLRRKH